MIHGETLSDQVCSTDQGERIWQQERTILDATERICELMLKNKVTRSDLAYRLGKSKGYVSQLLDGERNMTLRTLSDVFVALGRAVHITDANLNSGIDAPGVFRIFEETVGWKQPEQVRSTNTSHPKTIQVTDPAA